MNYHAYVMQQDQRYIPMEKTVKDTIEKRNGLNSKDKNF